MCKKASPSSPKYHRRRGDTLLSPIWRSLGWSGVPAGQSKQPCKQAKKEEEDRSLITYDELPEWAKDNHFIITGYRRIRACDAHCVESLFYLHNETVNIWR